MSEIPIDDMMMSFRASSDTKEKAKIRIGVGVAVNKEIKDYKASPPDLGMLSDWQQAALCRAFPEVMFQEKGEVWASKLAKKACGACVVRERCLTQALSNKDVAPFGVWGNTDHRERRRMLRAKKAA